MPSEWGPLTVYGTVDVGVGYNTNGAAYTAAWNNGVDSFMTKNNHGVKWLFTPNGLSQSVIGIKMSKSLAPIGLAGWSLVGTVETGFNPYYGYLADAQRSQVQNNGKALTLQGANNDSSRTGQWDNSQGFIGVSNKTYGTLTVGRVNTLSLDAINSYDPMGGSYAFSPLGFPAPLPALATQKPLAQIRRSNIGRTFRTLLLWREFPRRRPRAMGWLRSRQRHERPIPGPGRRRL